jgi:hypothetical protein
MFCYQVAYGTNELSYLYGFNVGFNDYKCTTNSDCDEPQATDDVNDCQFGISHNHNDAYLGNDRVLKGVHVVNNLTACVDGYVNGFKAWCKTDGLDCGFWALQGVFPSSLIALKNCIGWSAWHDHDDNLGCINGKAYERNGLK